MGNRGSYTSSTSETSGDSNNSSYPKFNYNEREYSYNGEHEEELQEFKCAICHDVIFEPTQTSCGHLFCAQCIEKIQNECPLCRCKDVTTTPDGYVTRKIGGIRVKCPNEGEGCSWEGTLGEAVHHLGNDCEYEEVECQHCEYRGHSKEVNYLHPTLCEAFPIHCPNQPRCGAMVTRATLEEHLEECPEQLVECEYAPAGCTVIINRRNVEEHMQRETERHSKLWKERIEQLSAIILTSQLNPLGVASLAFGRGICYRPWLHNPCLKEHPIPPYLLTIEFQSTSDKGRHEAKSEPFYSHAGGYKLYLRVVASTDDGNIYIGVSVHLLKGKHDDKLMFPFKGTLILTLMNQHTDRDHLEKTLQLNPKFCRKENQGIPHDNGNCSKFRPCCRWVDSSVPTYLLDGCLYVKVSPVHFDHDYMSTHLPV